MTRAALPQAVTTITPGYAWELVLDMLFDGVRPADWPDWRVRMHVWRVQGCAAALKLENGAGVTFETVEAGDGQGRVLPVIRMTAQQTESLRAGALHYVIDLTPPGGEAVDYLAGSMSQRLAPPKGAAA